MAVVASADGRRSTFYWNLEAGGLRDGVDGFKRCSMLNVYCKSKRGRPCKSRLKGRLVSTLETVLCRGSVRGVNVLMICSPPLVFIISLHFHALRLSPLSTLSSRSVASLFLPFHFARLTIRVLSESDSVAWGSPGLALLSLSCFGRKFGLLGAAGRTKTLRLVRPAHADCGRV
ncbi:hypothetical protein Mapa_009786 [Marchantia paleacea]|nr:hypothetical protein Mapa_009786 [Marchantia paleacea]